MKRGIRIAGALLLGTGIALPAVEFGLRRWAPVSYRARHEVPGWFAGLLHRPSDVPGLEYEMRPDFELYEVNDDVTIRTNSHGMRGPEVSVAKPPGVVRIATVGDSFTMGLGVEDHETYPSILQELLQERGPEDVRYEVLNFGVSGYSTYQEAIVVERKVLAFDPDLIVIGYVFNDPEAHPEWGLHMVFHEPAWWERYHVTRLVAQRLRARAVARYSSYTMYLHSEREPHWATVEQGLADVRAAAVKADVPVVLAVFPNLSREHDWDTCGHRPARFQVLKEARRNGFRILDVTARVRRLVAHPSEIILERHGHATPRGNRIFAEVFLEFLVAEHGDLLGWPADDRPKRRLNRR